MAHHCGNDGTDRSTLPIHGTRHIGWTGRPAVVFPLLVAKFFFEPFSFRRVYVGRADSIAGLGGAIATWFRRVAAFYRTVTVAAFLKVEEPIDSRGRGNLANARFAWRGVVHHWVASQAATILVEAIAFTTGVFAGEAAAVLVAVPNINVASIGSKILQERRRWQSGLMVGNTRLT